MTASARPVAVPGVVSACVAPVALIGGFTLAALAYPGGFDSAHGTISALAALGSPVRTLMTAALVVTGVCHVVTATSLRALRMPARALLAVGGVATLAVAAFPLPVTGTAPSHAVAAGVAFLAMSLWPGWIRARSGELPPVLRPPVTASVAAILTVMALTFFALAAGASTPIPLGTLERVLAGAQAVVPLLVVVALLTDVSRRRRAGAR
jgi:hypothetical membrane protein